MSQDTIQKQGWEFFWRHWLVEQMMKQPDRLTNRRQPSETKTTAFSKMQISCTCSIWHKKKILNSLKYFSVKIIAHANGLNSTQHVQQTSCVLVLLLIDCLFSCFSFVLFVAFIYPWHLRLAMVQNVKDTKENDSGWHFFSNNEDDGGDGKQFI